jgi:hypothetical protein
MVQIDFIRKSAARNAITMNHFSNKHGAGDKKRLTGRSKRPVNCTYFNRCASDIARFDQKARD